MTTPPSRCRKFLPENLTSNRLKLAELSQSSIRWRPCSRDRTRARLRIFRSIGRSFGDSDFRTQVRFALSRLAPGAWRVGPKGCPEHFFRVKAPPRSSNQQTKNQRPKTKDFRRHASSQPLTACMYWYDLSPPLESAPTDASTPLPRIVSLRRHLPLTPRSSFLRGLNPSRFRDPFPPQP